MNRRIWGGLLVAIATMPSLLIAQGIVSGGSEWAVAAAQLKTTYQDLAPDDETDIVLGEVRGASRNGVHGFSMRQTGSADAKDFIYFWVIDLSSRKYQVFKISDATVDAERIGHYFDGHGRSVPRERIRQQLASALTERSSRRFDPVQRRRSGNGPQEAQDITCSGWMYTLVDTLDPVNWFAFAPMTRTGASIAFGRADGAWSATTLGLAGCWANGSTFWGTVWRNMWCGGPNFSTSDGNVDSNYTGEYENSDFWANAWTTHVLAVAGVQWSSGSPNNYVEHIASGEASWFLQGLWVGEYQYNCPY